MDQGIWSVRSKLGEGGSGAVYLAETPAGERVAVKVLASREQGTLLEHEAKLLVRLQHAHIASLRGYLKDSSPIFGEDRGPCFWMEYVEGDDLPAAASKRPREKRDDEIFRWLHEALEALRYLHAQGVLHGDLSPGNIRIAADGGLKLIDFGMATAGREAMAGRAATLLYLAPERIGGQNGPACDLFSLGSIFYETIAGTHPRAGCRSLSDMIRKAAKPLLEARPDLSESHLVAARVIDRMILADRRERFGSAADVLEALSGGMSPKKAARTERVYPMTMVGVAEVFLRWTHALQAIDRRSRLLAVHGPTGTGKSRLLREFSFQCALEGRPVHEVEARPDQITTSGVFFLRNLERFDESEMTALFHLRKSMLPAKGALVVLEWNDDLLSEGQSAVLRRLVQHPDVEDIPLAALSRENSDALARMVLGADPGEDVLSFVYAQAMGNPMMILELLTLIREREAWTKEGLDALKGFTSIEKVLAQRLTDVGHKARELLSILATAHYPVGLEEILRMAGLEEDAYETLLLLDDLAARGFIVCDANGRYRLALPAMESFLLEKMTDTERRHFHAAWRDLLRDAKDPHPQKAHHRIAMGEIAEAASCVMPAVEELLRQKNRDEALRLIEEALPLFEGSQERAALSRLYRAKTNLLNDAGRFQEALESCERIMALAADDEPYALKRAKYWLISGLSHQNLGHDDEAVRRFRECLQWCETNGHQKETLRHYLVRSYTLLGLQAMQRNDPAQAKVLFEKGLEEDREGGRRRAEILRNLATVLSSEKDWEGVRRCLEESKKIYRDDHYYTGEFASWLLDGNLAVLRDDPEASDAAYREAERIATEHRNDLLLATAWNNRGTLARRRGDLASARDWGQRSLALFRDFGNPFDLAESLKQNAVTEAECGRFEKAEACIAEIRGLAAGFPQAAKKAEEAAILLLEYREGGYQPIDPELSRLHLPPHGDWNVELALRRLVREPREARIQEVLKQIYEKLPNPLKVSFVDRADYKRWILEKPQGGRS